MASSLLPSVPTPASTSAPLPSSPVATTEAEASNVVEARDGAAEDDSLTDLEYMARRMKRSLDDAADEDEDAPAWEQDAEDRPTDEAEVRAASPTPMCTF